MSNRKEEYFTIEEDAHDINHEVIWFWDEVSGRQVFAHDIRAFFDFKDQIQMMARDGHECSFLELVEQAKELETTFKAAMKILGKWAKE